MSEPGESTDESVQAFEEPTIPRPETPLVIIRRTPEEEEEEYRKFQEQITQEQLEEAQRKVETIMAQSNYTLTSHSIDDTQAEPQAQTVSWGKAVTSNDLNSGSLVRLFKSDFFDSWMGISYLYRYPSSGVHDYLCNALYTLPDDDMEFFLVELCTMLVHAEFGSSALERYIMDKCKNSVHFALQINWLMQASMADSEEKRRRAEMLQEKCEMATVNGTWDQPQPSVLLVQNHSNESASELLRMQLDGTLNLYSTPPRGLDLSSSGDISLPKSSSAPNLLQVHDQIESEALEKQDRCDYFYKILNFVEDLGRISERLRTVPVNLRQKQLVEELIKWNETFPVGIYLPLWEASTSHYCICRVVPEEGRVLKSRERAPFILVVEAIVSPEPAASKTVHKFAREADALTRRLREALAAQALSETTELPPDYEVPHQPEDAAPEPELAPLPDPSTYANSPFGEPWDVRVERIRRQSPYGRLPSWHIRSVIVKAGDDCRQEYLAMQLITQFKKIFNDADLPLYLRPYRILVNSTDSGLIETVTDAISIHQLKRFYTPEGSSQTISLTEHFRRFYGADTPEYEQAVKNFVESLAGYSLVCFLLQIKDRHNGNLMLDSAGHIIHIDFGFMLSNSPGQINAEKVPFKFTQEYLELMGGFSSPNFSYFKSLLLKGYLEVRKQNEKIILLVEIMAVGSKLPCFYTGQSAIDNLRDRFNLRMPEKQVVEFVENMLSTSFDSWRTRYYDRFQYMTNNILY